MGAVIETAVVLGNIARSKQILSRMIEKVYHDNLHAARVCFCDGGNKVFALTLYI